jgi:hypothetical protein
LKNTSRKKACGSVRLEFYTVNTAPLCIGLCTHAMISGLWLKGIAPVGKMRMHCRRIGAEKRIAAKLDGPAGSRVHQCSNIRPQLKVKLHEYLSVDISFTKYRGSHSYSELCWSDTSNKPMPVTRRRSVLDCDGYGTRLKIVVNY